MIMTSEEKKKLLESELSNEELKTVSGGVRINWPEKCAATVEDGSSCVGTDACYTLAIHYYRSYSRYGCSATTSVGGTCWTNDTCQLAEIKYDFTY